MKMLKKKETLSVEVKAKIGLMIILAVGLVVSIIFKAVNVREESPTLVTESESNMTEANIKLISNLDEKAVPLLDENAVLLSNRLEKYVEGMGKEIFSSEIFHITVPESDEKCLDFYVKLFPDNEIIKLTFFYKDNSVIASACEYTEEEIKNEIWNGEAPAIRDMQ